MSYNLCIWVIDLQGAEEGNHRGTLCGCTSVGIIAFFVQTTLITNANGVGIVMECVHADLFLWTGLMDLAIALNVVMIANAFVMESGVVIITELVNGVALVAARRRAMANDKIYLTGHSARFLEDLWCATLYGKGACHGSSDGCHKF
jgi:hypothetical protein